MKIDGGALPHTQWFFALVPGRQRLPETKRSDAGLHRLPCKPAWALGSLLSVALSSLAVKHIYLHMIEYVEYCIDKLDAREL